MSRKGIIILSLLVVIPAALYFLWPSDAARIRKLIAKGAEAVSKKDLDGVVACVSFTYQDEQGFSYALLKEGLKRFFALYDRIEIERDNLTVTVDDRTAKAAVDVRVLVTQGGNTYYLLGDAGAPVRLVFTLEKESLGWLVTRTAGMPRH